MPWNLNPRITSTATRFHFPEVGAASFRTTAPLGSRTSVASCWTQRSEFDAVSGNSVRTVWLAAAVRNTAPDASVPTAKKYDPLRSGAKLTEGGLPWADPTAVLPTSGS
jgi:hypothetical protein